MERRADGTYVGEISDENIQAIFAEAGDFNRRVLTVAGHVLYIYAIDGLTSGGDISEYVVKPLMQDTWGETPEALYESALHATVYNSVAGPCEDLNTVASRLVNGFCVVLFEDKALAFETKTGEKQRVVRVNALTGICKKLFNNNLFVSGNADEGVIADNCIAVFFAEDVGNRCT